MAEAAIPVPAPAGASAQPPAGAAPGRSLTAWASLFAGLTSGLTAELQTAARIGRATDRLLEGVSNG